MRKSLWALLLSLLVVLPASAQETRGNISGTVKDAQGVVPGATVKITNTDTNSSQTLVTNGNGYFEAPLLQPGTYTVSVEMPGFKNSSRAGIMLAIGQQITVPITLEVGQVSEKVTVTAEAPLLDTTAVSSGQNFDSRMVEGLPMFSNMPIMLTRFSMGVNPPASQSMVSQGFVDGTTGAAGEAVGGVGTNNYSLDGATNTGTSRRIAQSPNSDMVQEMRVESSNFDSSVGHGSGLQISMMTRAGTNAYRGTTSYTYWSNKFNALNPNQILTFTPEAKKYYEDGREHSLAVTFGGPVVLPKLDGRNKLFFFFNYSHVDDFIPGKNQGGSTVPYGAQLNGDFSDLLKLPSPAQYQIYDPLTVRPDPANSSRFIRTAFPNNIVPTSRIVNPLFNLYKTMLPPPNRNFVSEGQVPNANYYQGGQPDVPISTLYAGRVDYNKSGNDRFFARAQGNSFLERVGDWSYEVPPFEKLHSLDRNRPQWSFVGNWTHVSGATVIDSQFATNHFIQRDLYLGSHQYKPTDIGLPTYMDTFCQTAGDCVMPSINITGYQGFGTGSRSSSDIALNLQGIVNVTQVRGAHTIRGGFDVRQARRERTPGGTPSGTLSFTNDFTRQASDTSQLTPSGLGTGMAQFMMAIPTTTSISATASTFSSNAFTAAFGQDTWRLSRNLTVNIGLRFEWENGIKEQDDRTIVGFDPTATLAISSAAEAAFLAIPASQRALLPATISVRGGSVYASNAAAGNGGRSWAPEAMWMPRFSASYKLGDKTVLKAGYGVYYDTLNATDYSPTATGFSATTNNTNSTDFGQTFTLGNPYTGVLGTADPFPIRADGTRFNDPYGSALGIDTVAGGGYSDPNRNRVHGRQQKWRVGVQREVLKNLSVEIAYDGSYADRQDISIRQNYLPEQYWIPGTNNARDNTQQALLVGTVNNPFALTNFTALKATNPLLYQQMSSNSFFTSSTIQRQGLLRAFPQMNGALNYANLPLGENKVKQFQISANRRFSAGFTANAAVAFANVKANQTVEEFDQAPTIWLDTNNGRPYRITAGGVYELPFGSGKAMLKDGGVLAAIAGGWQVAGTFERQPGALLTFGSVFFTGDLSKIKLAKPEIGLDAKTGVIDNTKVWFNTAGFVTAAASQPTSFQTRNTNFPFYIDGLRGPGVTNANINFQRTVGIGGRRTVQLRMDIQNVFNIAAFSAPSTTPTSTSFGKVQASNGSAGAMRFMSFNFKLNF